MKLKWVKRSGGLLEAKTPFITYIVSGNRWWIDNTACTQFTDTQSLKVAKKSCQEHYNNAWFAGSYETVDLKRNRLFNQLQDELGLVDRWIEATGCNDPTTYKTRHNWLLINCQAKNGERYLIGNCATGDITVARWSDIRWIFEGGSWPADYPTHYKACPEIIGSI